ncbi:hypothetical protein Moror_12949 [Moniliophthora roreri MCA 2997]|uniref:Uncharacterized protein n=1 Tax=Moniliophthora roreri (strain MCA 2997) TaxID=1381753 RepID=V2XN34_MONRO|nr:hypothetical protein Moror_12949 [Moniliophthora roreri MCA 2997]
MFAISTFSVAIQAANVLLCLQILIDDDEQGMKTFRDRMYIPSGMEQALCLLTILVGDSVVIWRTWVLWSGNLKVLLAPCILLVGTTASIFAAWECMGRHLSSIDYSMDIPECVSLARVTYALSGATNVAATVAIGYKVWLHRQVARKYLATLKTRSRAEKVITLTLAFGGLYCIVLVTLAFGLFKAVYTYTVSRL